MPSSIAPLVTGFGRRPGRHSLLPPYPNTPGAAPIDGGDGGPIGLMVELYLGSLGWTDISQWVYYRDGTTQIPITRGRGDETSQVGPQSATLVLDNRDGRFSPRNPVGPWYRQLGRNTQVRVSRLNNGVRRYRFYGEIPAWPTTSDISHSDITVTVTAAGMLRRLTQGTPPAYSEMYRAYVFGEAPTLVPVAYWPCEDGATATSLASGLPSGTAMTFTGTPTLASSSVFICSKPLPVINSSIWTGTVPALAAPATWQDNVLRFLLSVPAAGEPDQSIIASIFTTGTVARYDLVYGTVSGGSVSLRGYNSSGATLFSSGFFVVNLNGNPARASMALRTSGANLIYEFQNLLPGQSVAGVANGTLTSATIGAVTKVVFNPGGTMVNSVFGHASMQAVWDDLGDLAAPLNAWLLENPINRFRRLLLEQGINAIEVLSGPGETFMMGYQLPDAVMNLVQQCVDSSTNLLFESRDQLALAMRSRIALYNQSPHLTLDWSQNQLSGPLIPLDDDVYTRNDVTVSRIGGSSAQATLTTGALSTQQPPNGVGPYGTNYSISLSGDGLLADQAGWRLHMGTVDEPRYPTVSINLRHTTFTSNLDLMNAALTLDIGDRIVIKNPPTPDFPPDDISLIVQGYSEVLGIFEHDMVLNCSPESPYRIAILEDQVLGHLDTDGSTLVGNYPLGTETTLSVATTGAATGSALWTTSAGDFPFDILVSGERMTVTNITGSSSPQTFFVTRSINGVVKAQTSTTDVRLWQPMILSL